MPPFEGKARDSRAQHATTSRAVIRKSDPLLAAQRGVRRRADGGHWNKYPENHSPPRMQDARRQRLGGKQQRKQRLHALDSADRKTADGKLSEWLRDLAVVDTTAKDLTVGGLLERFLSARAGRKEGTRITEKAIANVFKRTFEPGMGTLVARVKASALLTWLSEQGESRNWKNRTYNRRRLFLSQMFGLAVADNAISEVQNPFKTQIIRAKRKEKVFRRIPTPDQFQTIVESIRAQKCNAQHEDSADFVEFLGLAGVGQAEASALRWADVDFDSARINFIRRKTERDYYVPMYDWLRPFMERLRERAGGKPAHDERVFKIDDAKHALGNACKRLKLPHFTQRNLRAMLIKRLHDGCDAPSRRQNRHAP